MNHDAITDNEPIFRRVPRASYPDPQFFPIKVFNPHERNDIDGLSVSRGKTPEHPEFLSPEELAKIGHSPKGYFIIELLAADLFANAIRIEVAPTAGDPGHCLLVDLRSDNRKTDESRELMTKLFELKRAIHGPFSGTPREE